MGILNSVAIGVGEAAKAAQPYIANMQVAEIQKLRDERLAEVSKLSQERGFAHADKTLDKTQTFQAGERAAGQEFQRGMETEVRQPFQRTENEATRELTRTQMGETSRHNKATEKNQASALGLQAQQVGAAVKQAELAVTKGTLEVESLQRVKKLQDDYLAAPADQRDAIADQIYTLAGKDKFSPVVGKDNDGNPQFVGAFNTRSGKLETRF